MPEQTDTHTPPLPAPEPTPVVLLPSGNIAYKMPCWWREIGPDGKDYGNLPVLPKGAVRMVPAPQPAPDIRAQAIEVLARAQYELHFARWDDTEEEDRQAWRRSMGHLVNALAEAGLLPTDPAGYFVGWQESDGRVSIALDESEPIFGGGPDRIAYRTLGEAHEFLAEVAPEDPDTQFVVYALREVTL